MADKERVVVEEVEHSESVEKPKKGLKITIIIIGLIAMIQCVALFVIFKDQITSFFESLKPEPVEVSLVYPLEPTVVNLADKETRRFLKATIALEYGDEALSTVLEERIAEVQAKVIEVLRSKTYEQLDSVEDTHQVSVEIVEALNQTFETEAFKNAHFTEYILQ